MNIEMVERFLVRNSLNSYPAIISNKWRTHIKNLFIQFIEILKQRNLIESYFKVLVDQSFESVDKLNNSNINEGFTIYKKVHF